MSVVYGISLGDSAHSVHRIRVEVRAAFVYLCETHNNVTESLLIVAQEQVRFIVVFVVGVERFGIIKLAELGIKFLELHEKIVGERLSAVVILTLVCHKVCKFR